MATWDEGVEEFRCAARGALHRGRDADYPQRDRGRRLGQAAGCGEAPVSRSGTRDHRDAALTTLPLGAAGRDDGHGK